MLSITQPLYIFPYGLVNHSHLSSTSKKKNFLPFGNNSFFLRAKIISRNKKGNAKTIADLSSIELLDWAHKRPREESETLLETIENITKPRKAILGFSIKRPIIMGILNVTKDSFYNASAHLNQTHAINYGKKLHEKGADIIDVGGESTRPGAITIDPQLEEKRIIPIISKLSQKGICVSCDTRNLNTMKSAISSGAKIINDISALTHCLESPKIIANSNIHVILMHMKGTPKNMQKNPKYKSAPLDVYDFLKSRIFIARQFGIKIEKIIIDPGIGFGKLQKHNEEILKYLPIFKGLGCPIMIGLSRKSMLHKFSKSKNPKEQLPASLALANFAFNNGVEILRVHDPEESLQSLNVASTFRV